MTFAAGLCVVGIVAAFKTADAVAAEVRLEQVISRESPLFRCASARLTIGRDGFVYITSESQGKGFCLRLSRDGRQKRGGEVVYAIHNGTANDHGVVATANAHFNHSLNLYDGAFQKLAHADDFLVNDQVGWDAPSHVEAGSSGDFFGLDQHRNRVVRVGEDGKVKAVYPVRAPQEQDWGKPTDFRVCEALQSFYWLANGQLIRTRWDGTTLWKMAVPVQYRWDVGSYGGFDVDDQGQVSLIDGMGQAVSRFNADSTPLPAIPLSMDELKPVAGTTITALRVFGTDLVLRRSSSTELFQVYDNVSGKRKHVESIEHEQLAVTVPSLVWTCGERIRVGISFHSATTRVAPRFRIWATPFGLSDWTELPRDDQGEALVPTNWAGLYQIKVTPEALPRQSDEPSEYLIREIVEIRRPSSLGTIAVVTPLNRHAYSIFEDISGRVVARSPSVSISQVELRLRDPLTDTVLTTMAVPLEKSAEASGESVGRFCISNLSSLIKQPGHYQLEVDVPDLTCVPQRLMIGAATDRQISLRRMLYGDYGLTSPQRNAWEFADSALATVDRQNRMGLNQFINRTQQLSLDFPNDDNGRGLLNRIKQRLKSDPAAVTPEKAEFGSAHHSMAGLYSALGWREYLILVYMDGGLPLGTGHDRRTAAQFADAIQRFTESLWNYAGFQGWAWVANWWLYEPDAKFASPDEKAAYEVALKEAAAGPWNEILDRIEDRKYAFAVDAQQGFNKALKAADELSARREQIPARGFKTASAGPYRRPEVLPEVNFANVDFMDVHYQAEQITTPDWIPHGIDVSRRQGQELWVHPELWNDFGTGEQILPSLWMALLRGAHGIGTSGNIPNWPAVSLDSRSAYQGTTSVFRSLFRATEELSEPLRGIQECTEPWNDHERVGIVVSPRQLKIETFGHGVGSPTFSRQFEAYQSFLYANCPARFVSLEEIRQRFLASSKPSGSDLRNSFDGLLLVGQTVDLEPEWKELLKLASAAGVRILADGTCRSERWPSAQPLGITFDAIEKVHSANSDDAFYLYPSRFRKNALALQPVIRDLIKASRRPANRAILVEAQSADNLDQSAVVLIQEFATKDSRLVMVVNNTPTLLPPGQLRKVGRAISTRSPVVAQIKIQLSSDETVIDLFSGQELSGEITADLRDTYARLYQIINRRSLSSQGEKIRQSVPGELALNSNLPRLDQSFGPHLRDVAVSPDGKSALLNAFNWDHNLYGIDLTTGSVRFRKKVGDHFAYGPVSTEDGDFVQGYDLNSAEGYHFYTVDKEGVSSRRYALPAIPGCLTGWAFTAWIQDHVNNFTASPKGDWVAAAGNLAVAVWDRQGRILWQEDWSESTRQTYLMQALGPDQLVMARGMNLETRQATTGRELWSLSLANSGEIQAIHSSGDGRTIAVRTSHSGGRVYVIRDGLIASQLPTAADDLSLSGDGSVIALTTGSQLKVYEQERTGGAMRHGLKWLAHGDDQLRFPRVSAEGRRIAVSSEIGTLLVFKEDGTLVHRQDEGGLVATVWLPDGDLLTAGWSGVVARLDPHFRDRWRTHVRAGEQLACATTIDRGTRSIVPSTSRVTSWIRAQTSIPDRPNLLSPNQFIASWMLGDYAATPARPMNDLADGKHWLAVDNGSSTSSIDRVVGPELQVDAVAVVGQGTGIGGVHADVVPGDRVAGRTGIVQTDAVQQIARDHVAGRAAAADGVAAGR